MFSQSPYGNTKGAKQLNKYPLSQQHLALKQSTEKSAQAQISECLKNIDRKDKRASCREPASAESRIQ